MRISDWSSDVCSSDLPWGEQRLIRDKHSELKVTLAGDTPLSQAVGVTFRLFDDGFGFRYDYAGIPAGQAVAVTADHSQFRTVGAYRAWWYEALGVDRDEYLYKERSEEHTSDLQSLMRISSAVFGLKKKTR